VAKQSNTKLVSVKHVKSAEFNVSKSQSIVVLAFPEYPEPQFCTPGYQLG
jgi:hypothetical protein